MARKQKDKMRYVTVPIWVWDLFRKKYRISKMVNNEAIKELEPPDPYPRMHFKCEYTGELVRVKVHYDYENHKSIYSVQNKNWLDLLARFNQEKGKK